MYPLNQYKVITLFKRRSGMSVEEFQSYWRERHGPLAAQTPGVRRYVQSHTLPQGYRKASIIFDGISEMWFDSRTAFEESATDTRFNARLTADLHKFTADGHQIIMPVEVKVIVDGSIPQAGVKNIEFVNCRPGVDLRAFRDYWEHQHGPLASGIKLMRRYEQNHLRLHEYAHGSVPAYDGLAISWFDSTDDMKKGSKTEIYTRTRADEANFLPDGHLPFIVTREHEVLPA